MHCWAISWEETVKRLDLKSCFSHFNHKYLWCLNFQLTMGTILVQALVWILQVHLPSHSGELSKSSFPVKIHQVLSILMILWNYIVQLLVKCLWALVEKKSACLHCLYLKILNCFGQIGLLCVKCPQNLC